MLETYHCQATGNGNRGKKWFEAYISTLGVLGRGGWSQRGAFLVLKVRGVWTGKEEAGGVGSQVRTERVSHWSIGEGGGCRDNEIRAPQALEVQLRRCTWSRRQRGASEDWRKWGDSGVLKGRNFAIPEARMGA